MKASLESIDMKNKNQLTLIVAPDSFLILDMLEPDLPIKPPTRVSDITISKVT